MFKINKSIASGFVSSDLSISEDFTVEFWMNLSDQAVQMEGSHFNKTLIDCPDPVNNLGQLNTQITFRLIQSEDTPHLQILFGNLYFTITTIVKLEENIKPNEWHHYAIVLRPWRDISDLRNVRPQYLELVLYIDGDQAPSKWAVTPNFPIRYPLNNVPLKLAFHGSESIALFTELRCWNRALNGQEIYGAMQHQLNGDEPELIGRWGFENGSAEDSSQMRMNGLLIDPPQLKDNIPELTAPFSSEHLVVQTRLMQDYIHKKNETSEEISSHHVVISARDKFGTPLAFKKLTLALHTMDYFMGNDTVNIQVQHFRKIEMCELAIQGEIRGREGIVEEVELTTNSMGQVSFNVLATSFIAPVFRVYSDFMPDAEHALLVFPDRHTHHILSSLPRDFISNFWSWKDANNLTLGSRFYDPERGYQNPSSHTREKMKRDRGGISSGIKQVMRTAADSNRLNEYHNIRTRSDELHKSPTVRPKPDHENIHISSKSFDRDSDVISGYSVKNRSPLVKGLFGGNMPAWQLHKTGDNTSGLFSYQDDIPLETMLHGLSPIGDDDLANRLLRMHHGGCKRSVIDSNELSNLLDSSTRKRNLTDLVSKVSSAGRIIMYTVEGKVQDASTDVEKDIQALIMVLVDDGEQAKAYAIHRTVHAAHIVEGLLKAMEVEVEDFIKFIRSYFDWKRVIGVAEISNEVMKQHKKVSSTILDYMREPFENEVIKVKNKISNDIDNLITKIKEPSVKLAMIKGQSNKRHHKPPDVRSSYLHRMVANHAADTTTTYTSLNNPTQSQRHSDFMTVLGDRIKAAKINQKAPLSKLNKDSKIYDLIKDNILQDCAVNFLEGVKELDNSVFDLVTKDIDWVFNEIDGLLNESELAANAEIDIPYLSKFYSYLFSEYASKSKLKSLSIMNLVLLAGAVPTWVIRHSKYYGNDNLLANYDGSPLKPKSIGKSIELLDNRLTNSVPQNEQPLSKKEIEARKRARNVAAVAMAGTFETLVILHTIFMGLERGLELNGETVVIEKISTVVGVIRHVFTPLLQLSQVPVDAMHYRLPNFSNDPHDTSHRKSAITEIVIWISQWIPVVIDFVIAVKTLQGANVPFEDRWQSPFYDKQLFKLPAIGNLIVSIYGGLHAALFIILAIEETTELFDGSTHEPGEGFDIGFKVVGNLASCVPEICAFPGYAMAELAIYDSEPTTKVDLLTSANKYLANDLMSNGLWWIISTIRLGKAIDDQRNFVAK